MRFLNCPEWKFQLRPHRIPASTHVFYTPDPCHAQLSHRIDGVFETHSGDASSTASVSAQTSRPLSTPSQTARRKGSINPSRNTYATIVTTNRTTGPTISTLRNSHTTILFIHLHNIHLSKPIMATTHSTLRLTPTRLSEHGVSHGV
jgi:hypothetical protein